jgi:hypothetical protein|tara:strand:- start:3677 stop:4177 length:501 start_codon:yes stop_codon:yes gene_type:complete
MQRDYDNGINEDVNFFVGTEVEHTPMFGKKTLFVVGTQNYEDIITYATNGIKHIYIGANMSFKPDEAYDAMIFPLLKEGYWVTLDFDIKDVEWVLESGYTEYNRFIPMISAKLPYISQLGYNACLKLDDKDFDATNPGVWVHRMHDLKEKAVFTDWSKYTTDEIIG